MPDKRQIAASFSRAAETYDSVAGLQRRVVHQLLARYVSTRPVQRWLDLGCGTGYGARLLASQLPAAQGMALDLAEGMLRHAQPLGGAQYFFAGDAEQLPLRDGCVELVFSSLALQWCDDFAQVLAEVQRVLRPGGTLLFSSLVAGTLTELRQSWAQVDGHVHVNPFRSFGRYQALCRESALAGSLEVVPEVLHFPDLRSLSHELKALGAQNLNSGRPEGLTGRIRVRALLDAYEQYRTDAGLPATYQVVYGVLHKES